jgi:hypothetical protein
MTLTDCFKTAFVYEIEKAADGEYDWKKDFEINAEEWVIFVIENAIDDGIVDEVDMDEAMDLAWEVFYEIK